MGGFCCTTDGVVVAQVVARTARGLILGPETFE